MHCLCGQQVGGAQPAAAHLVTTHPAVARVPPRPVGAGRGGVGAGRRGVGAGRVVLQRRVGERVAGAREGVALVDVRAVDRAAPGRHEARPAREWKLTAHSSQRTGASLPGRCASIFRDKNRRCTGKSQSKRRTQGRNGRRTGTPARGPRPARRSCTRTARSRSGRFPSRRPAGPSAPPWPRSAQPAACARVGSVSSSPKRRENSARRAPAEA
jgi:hypothetical protein